MAAGGALTALTDVSERKRKKAAPSKQLYGVQRGLHDKLASGMQQKSVCITAWSICYRNQSLSCSCCKSPWRIAWHLAPTLRFNNRATKEKTFKGKQTCTASLQTWVAKHLGVCFHPCSDAARCGITLDNKMPAIPDFTAPVTNPVEIKNALVQVEGLISFPVCGLYHDPNVAFSTPKRSSRKLSNCPLLLSKFTSSLVWSAACSRKRGTVHSSLPNSRTCFFLFSPGSGVGR